nr:SLBB domain-containing protein [Pleionea sediminis]
MKILKIGFLLAIGLSSSIAEEIDVAKAQQMCQNATAQQKQMAKAAGYDLDSLCSSVANSAKTETLDNPKLVNPRTSTTRNTDTNLNINQSPLGLFTPEQIAAMSPEQLLEITRQAQDSNPTLKSESPLDLQPFGYDLFAGEPTTFAPATQIPVPVNYIIGPGDTLEIQLFGKMSQQLSLLVNRDGQINFPELGPISLTGLSFSEAKQLLHKRIKEQMIGVDAAISLGELRSIQVFILGEAYKPGSYTVSSLSTMTNALFVSGGINDIGSLRNIQLKRSGQLVSSLDLYDLLMRGDTSNDARLFPGDVIYIPPVGKTASINGAVKRPAIYELKNEKDVKDLVRLAGGLSATAYKNEAQLTRINESGFTTVLEVNLPHKSTLDLKSGDSLVVQERVDVNRQSVKLSGHVYRPKKVAWRPNLKVSDLVQSFDTFKPLPQLDSAILLRKTLPLYSLDIEVVNLSEALSNKSSTANKVLNPQDELIILGYSEERDSVLEPVIEMLKKQASSKHSTKTISVSGMVRYPGEYPLANNMTVSELIKLAGGLAESAYTLSGEVTRVSLKDPEKTSIKHFVISLDQGSNESESFILQSRDVLNIRQRPEFREFASVEVMGEVKFPGTYRIKKGETLKDLMKRAGGFTDFAHIEAAVFTRVELKERETKQLKELRERLKSDIANSQLEQSNTGKNANLSSLEQLMESLGTTEALGRLVVDLKEILSSDSENVILKDGDILVIPSFRQEVSVVGEVQYPTSHLYNSDLSFEEYIERSGGETDKADDERIYIVKADGSVVLPYKSGWINATGVSIEPGDTIVVPLDVDATNDLALWTNVSQIVYQLALGAAAFSSL